jgi:ArsR family transcriptional regulator
MILAVQTIDIYKTIKYMFNSGGEVVQEKELVCDEFSPSVKSEELRSGLEALAQAAELFKALGDETRLKIVYLLTQRELCVCDLASILELTAPAVSHHLRLLRALRLVRPRREGKMVYYALRGEHTQNVVHEVLATIME